MRSHYKRSHGLYVYSWGHYPASNDSAEQWVAALSNNHIVASEISQDDLEQQLDAMNVRFEPQSVDLAEVANSL
jgi:hypothetical protein